MSRRTRLALLGLLAIGVAAHAAHALLGPHGTSIEPIFANWLYLALELGAAALIFARAVVEPRERWAWAALGSGLLLWAAGDLVWALWLDALSDPPFPSIADGLYFASYVGLYVGIVLLLRDRVRPWSGQRWIDGLIGGLTTAAIACALVFPAVLHATEGSAAAVAVTLAYPLLDLLLLCFIVVAMALNRWRRERTWMLLGAGLVCMVVADCISTYQEATGSYQAGTILDSLWPLAMLLIAAAAWQPARPSHDVATSHRAAYLPGLFAIAALALLIYAGLATVDPLAVGLAGSALALVVVRAALLLRENRRLLLAATRESLTDGLTGLANRRALVRTLDAYFADEEPQRPWTLALFDLNGFKTYNDTFGHAAGDDLLRRLAAQLQEAVHGRARAFRLGGDEFCLLVERDAGPGDPVLVDAVGALSATGDRLSVTTSIGSVVMPREAASPGEALLLADQRMYADKGAREGATRGAAREVLLQLLSEREPGLLRHMSDVAVLTRNVGLRMGLAAEDLDVAVRAAELHDVGKVAIPDSILHKATPLDANERRFMRKHTLIGQRIIAAASALRPVGAVVRSSHERWDGGGYPDGLAGEDISLAARIVCACDAFDAMTTARAYRRALSDGEALAELERHAGTQFDPQVVAVLADVVRARRDDTPTARTGEPAGPPVASP